MSHSVALGVFLLSLVSTQASQPTTIIAKTREVIVETDAPTKGFSSKSFCARALQKADPTAVIMVGKDPIPVAEFCTYATHNGGSVGNSYIKYDKAPNKAESKAEGKKTWMSPTDFCAQQKSADYNKLVTIKYEGVIANPKRPTKSVGEYCKGYGVNLE